MKVKIVYSNESASAADKASRILKEAGAFIDEERWLSEQMEEALSIRYANDRQPQAEAIGNLLKSELGPFTLKLLGSVHKYDVEIYIARSALTRKAP